MCCNRVAACLVSAALVSCTPQSEPALTEADRETNGMTRRRRVMKRSRVHQSVRGG